MSNIPMETCRAVWAAMGASRSNTLDELQLLTGCTPGECWQYVGFLMQHGYAQAGGVRRADSGETIPIVALIVWSGPEAPYPDEHGNLRDLNRDRQGRERRARQGRGEMPTLRARMRWAAECINGPFSRSELRAAVDLGTATIGSFQRIWDELRRREEFQRTQAPGMYRYIMPDGVASIRDYLAGHAGADVLIGELAEELGRPVSGCKVRLVLDLMAAQGYLVSARSIKNRRVAVYRVEARAEDHECGNDQNRTG